MLYLSPNKNAAAGSIESAAIFLRLKAAGGSGCHVGFDGYDFWCLVAGGGYEKAKMLACGCREVGRLFLSFYIFGVRGGGSLGFV